jgi:apolipoprotein D and lipocalin family protein
MNKLINTVMKSSFLILFCLSLVGCLGIPENVRPITGFELDRYLGAWYEIARLDHSFERGLSNVTAEYRLRDDGGVKVINRGFDSNKNSWNEAVGKAFFIGDSSVGQLKVSFFGPFYGAYNIVALDEEAYGWSLVVGPDTDYFWILSRSKDLDKATIEQLLSMASSFGINTSDLIFVEHD